MSQDRHDQRDRPERLPGEPNCGWVDALGEHATNPPVPRTQGEVVFQFGDCLACQGHGTVYAVRDGREGEVPCPECQLPADRGTDEPGTGRGREVVREWTVSGDEVRIRAQYEGWVRRNAMRDLADLEGASPDQVRAMHAAYIADRAAGAYNWDGAACRASRGDLPGLKHLFYLLLRRCHPEVTESVAAALFMEEQGQVALAMNWVLGNWKSQTRRGRGRRGRRPALGDQPTTQEQRPPGTGMPEEVQRIVRAEMDRATQSRLTDPPRFQTTQPTALGQPATPPLRTRAPATLDAD